MKEDGLKFVSAHHEKAEMSWDQERKLRLSCEVRHLRYRHPDDLAMLLLKAMQKTAAARPAIQAKLSEFNKRDNVDVALESRLSDVEQQAYARRLTQDLECLESRYAGDLAQIVEHLIESKVVEEAWVTGELQRTNIVQSEARKKLRK